MNKVRIEALRRVMGGLSQTEFADRHDLNASYLSQLLGGHRSFGEKAAMNMEAKIGLRPGELSVILVDEAHRSAGGQVTPDVATKVASDIQSLGLTATPRSRIVLQRIAKAAEDGRITEADLDLLDQIASRFEKASTQKDTQNTQGRHPKLREKLKSNDSST